MKLKDYTIRAERCTDQVFNPPYWGKYRHKKWKRGIWRYVTTQYGSKICFIGASFARDFAQQEAEKNALS